MIDDNGNAFINISVQCRVRTLICIRRESETRCFLVLTFSVFSSRESKRKAYPTLAPSPSLSLRSGLKSTRLCPEARKPHHCVRGSVGAGALLHPSLAPAVKTKSQGIAAPPYLPGQHNYAHNAPTRRYYVFTARIGWRSKGEVRDCLHKK
jgi:hypothetical protein